MVIINRVRRWGRDGPRCQVANHHKGFDRSGRRRLGPLAQCDLFRRTRPSSAPPRKRAPTSAKGFRRFIRFLSGASSSFSHFTEKARLCGGGPLERGRGGRVSPHFRIFGTDDPNLPYDLSHLLPRPAGLPVAQQNSRGWAFHPPPHPTPRPSSPAVPGALWGAVSFLTNTGPCPSSRLRRCPRPVHAATAASTAPSARPCSRPGPPPPRPAAESVGFHLGRLRPATLARRGARASLPPRAQYLPGHTLGPARLEAHHAVPGLLLSNPPPPSLCLRPRAPLSPWLRLRRSRRLGVLTSAARTSAAGTKEERAFRALLALAVGADAGSPRGNAYRPPGRPDEALP